MESPLTGSAPPGPSPLPRPLGRYELVEILGGGMSEVYRARIADAIGPERPLVVKLAAQSVSDDPKASVRFLDEAKLALALSHGNITSAFEFGKAEGRYFIVMEYVRGGSVRQIVESARRVGRVLPAGVALSIGVEVARALQYAHTFVHPELGPMPLVHRDVNPSNVLVARDGQVKLTDFGIAHALGRDPSHGVIWGQAHYVAPELFDGAAASAVADLYALGAVLFHLLTLESPFPGESEAEILLAVRTGTVPSVRTIRPELPDEVDRVIGSLLARDPSQRPGSAEDVRRALEGLRDLAAPGFRTEELAKTVRELMGPEIGGAGTSGRHLAVSEPTVPLMAAGPSSPAPSAIPVVGTSRAAPVPTNPRTLPASPGRRAAVLLLALLVAVAAGVLAWSRFRPDPSPRHPRVARPAQVAIARPAPSKAPTPRAEGPTPPIAAEVVRTPAGRTGHSKRVVASPVPPVPPPPVEPTRAAPAVVTLNSWPWSNVTVDGRRLPGHTPLRNIELSQGSHSVLFENPELRMRRSISVTLSAGERRVVSAMLEPSDLPSKQP